MKTTLEKNQEFSNIQISDQFIMNTIVAVDELHDHDMIYIYHHLKLGSVVHLTADGTDVKGNLRYSVSFKTFKLGYITLSSVVHSIYENETVLEGKIVGLKKQKFLPIRAIDISLQATKMRMVS